MQLGPLLGGGGRVFLLPLIACIAALAAYLRLPPPLYTHHDTIAFTLARHEIRYADIAFEQTFEERQNVRVFSAGVRVRLRDGRIAHGWIGCENRESDCFLELRSLGIRGERLPPLTPRPAIPWLLQAEQVLNRMREQALRP